MTLSGLLPRILRRALNDKKMCVILSAFREESYATKFKFNWMVNQDS